MMMMVVTGCAVVVACNKWGVEVVFELLFCVHIYTAASSLNIFLTPAISGTACTIGTSCPCAPFRDAYR